LSHNKIFGEIYDRGARAGFSESSEEGGHAIPFALCAIPARTLAPHVSAELYSQLFYTPLYCGHILSPESSTIGIYESNVGNNSIISRCKIFHITYSPNNFINILLILLILLILYYIAI